MGFPLLPKTFDTKLKPKKATGMLPDLVPADND